MIDKITPLRPNAALHLPLSLYVRIYCALIFLFFFTLLLKIGNLGTFWAPCLDIWPCVLGYCSIFLIPFVKPMPLFLFGLIYDGIYDAPLGMHGCTWMIVYFILALQRKKLLKISVFNLWLILALSITFLNGIQILWCFLVYDIIEPPLYKLLEIILSCAFIPWVLHGCHKLFMRLSVFL